MKSKTSGLFDRLVQPEGLDAAWREARRGKRRSVGAAQMAAREEEAIHGLAAILAAERWFPAGYRTWIVRHPKPRLIAAAPFVDRVVHHAVHAVLAPVLQRSFLPETFACLPGRGTHRGVLRFQAGLRRHRYLARIDIRRYFLEIDHGIVLALMDHRIDDPPLRRLVVRLLESGRDLYADPSLQAALGILGVYQHRPDKGLPIGNLTSQLFANAYLDGADHLIKRELKIPFYIRYMDDLVLFDDQPRRLGERVGRLLEWLRVERRLEARCKRAVVERTTGAFTFLGYTVDRAQRRISGATLRRMRARLRDLVLQGTLEHEAIEETWAATLKGLMF